jgi:hypothetical protein
MTLKLIVALGLFALSLAAVHNILMALTACEFCGARMKTRFGKPPVCTSCARQPSEADVHI